MKEGLNRAGLALLIVSLFGTVAGLWYVVLGLDVNIVVRIILSIVMSAVSIGVSTIAVEAWRS